MTRRPVGPVGNNPLPSMYDISIHISTYIGLIFLFVNVGI